MLQVYLSYGRVLMHRLMSGLDDDTGVETIEWIGLAAVILAAIGAMATFMTNQGGQSIAEALVGTITSWINSMAGGGE